MSKEEQALHPDYLSVADIAQAIGTSEGMVRSDIEQGKLPAIKQQGGHLFVAWQDAQNYIQIRKRLEESITCAEAHRRTGKSLRLLVHHIQAGQLPAVRLSEGKSSTYYIREQDLATFCQQQGWTYYVPWPPKEEVFGSTGTPDQCGACGSTRGNILGDLHQKTHVRLGYLCTPCARLVHGWQHDVSRLRKVLKYLEYTRKKLS